MSFCAPWTEKAILMIRLHTSLPALLALIDRSRGVQDKVHAVGTVCYLTKLSFFFLLLFWENSICSFGSKWMNECRTFMESRWPKDLNIFYSERHLKFLLPNNWAINHWHILNHFKPSANMCNTCCHMRELCVVPMQRTCVFDAGSKYGLFT